MRICRRLRFAVGFALAFVVWHVIDLSRYPMIADDEVVLNEPARTLAQNGHLDSPLLTSDHRDTPLVVQPPVQAFAVAAFYRAFGFGLWQTRLASVTWGAIAIALIVFVASTFPAEQAAPVAVLLLFVNPSFATSARMGRMDTLCVAFILAAYYCYLAARREAVGRVPFVFAGLFIGLACLTHPVAMGVLIGTALLIVFASKRDGLLALSLFASGGLLIAALWGVLILSGREHYLVDLIRHGSMRSVSGSPGSRIVAECIRWLTEIRRTPVLFACYVAGIGWRNRWPSDRRVSSELLLLAVVAILFNTFVMSKMSGYYTLYPQLFLTLLAAGSIASAIQHGGRYRHWAMILLCLLAVTSVPTLIVPRLVAATVQDQARDYSPIREQLQATIPIGSTVWSVPEGWYALAEGRSVRTSSLDYNLTPNPRVDDFAVANAAAPLRDPGFAEVSRVGREIPMWRGRTFATTDYRLIVYRSRLR